MLRRSEYQVRRRDAGKPFGYQSSTNPGSDQLAVPIRICFFMPLLSFFLTRARISFRPMNEVRGVVDVYRAAPLWKPKRNQVQGRQPPRAEASPPGSSPHARQNRSETLAVHRQRTPG